MKSEKIQFDYKSLSGPGGKKEVVQLPYIEIDTSGAASYGDEIHLREYVKRVFRYKWMVLLITLLITAIAAYFIFTQPIVYQATAQIQVDTETESELARPRGLSTFEDRAYFNTQLELLENPKLIRKVIKKYDLDTNKVFLDSRFLEDNSLINRVNNQDFTGKSVDSPGTPVVKYAGYDAEAEKLNPYVRAIQKNLSVQPVLQKKQSVKDTRLIAIKFEHPNPQISAIVSNALADELVSANLESKLETNTGEQDYLEKNISDLKAKIRRSENQLLEYGRNYQLPTQDDKQNTVVERLAGLNRQLLEAENERKRAEAAYKSGTAPGVADVLAESGVKQINDIEAKLDELRQKRETLLVEVTEKYPEVQEIDRQMAVLKKAIGNQRARAKSSYKTELATKYKQAVAREKAIRKSYNQQWQKTLAQNSGAINYRIIQRELETDRKMLDEMQQRQMQTEMIKAKTPNNIQVAEYAVTPSDPVDQNRLPYLALAFIFSFSFGIGSALLRDYFDDSVHSTEEVEQTLNLSSIAQISDISSDSGSSSISKHGQKLKNFQLPDLPETKSGKELTINSNGNTQMVEAFLQLRKVLLLSPVVGSIKKLLITSSRQGEGKTASAINIATSLTDSGASVLLIDTDLCSPGLHEVLNLPNERGLSNLLMRDVEIAEKNELLVRQDENFYVLPSGPVSFDCSELLNRRRMNELLTALESEFDYIIIDSSPVSMDADSAFLASIADGVLLIAQENKSSSEALRNTKKQLAMVGAKVVGVVLNKADHSADSNGYQTN